MEILTKYFWLIQNTLGIAENEMWVEAQSTAVVEQTCIRHSNWYMQSPSSVMFGLNNSRSRYSDINLTITQKVSSSFIIVKSNPTMKALPWQYPTVK